MPNTAFSLTERVIINPVLHMRAELLNDPKSPHGISKRAWHFIEAEIFARVTAIFTSIFAAADAFVHFLSGCYKGTHLLLGKCCNIQVSWNKSEVYEHFRRATFFSGIALVGSVAGTVWPGVFKYFRQSPSDPFSGGDNINDILPGTIHNLAEAVQTKKEQAPFHQLQELWGNSSLSSKHWFVQAFNQNADQFKAVRETLADTVYRPISFNRSHKTQVRWLNETEITGQVDSVWERTNAFSKGFFFHATSEKALESILKAKKVEVRHEKAYRGAFVSTQPELAFGRCVLVFKRNIERLSTLEHGFTTNKNTYWAGFSRDIPVSDSTLAYIILDSLSACERLALEIRCEQWTGRKIDVILIDDARVKLKKVKALQMGIPREWPDEGEEAGLKILNAMTVAIAVQQPVAVQQRRRVAQTSEIACFRVL